MASVQAQEENPEAGYAQLADFMGAHPEIAIFRRFAALNRTTLLHLQAELCELEQSLQQYARADAESAVAKRMDYNHYWLGISESESAEGGNPAQWITLQTIREKLHQYNHTLLLQHMVTNVGSPNKRDLKFLQTWMGMPKMGHVLLFGSDRDIWESCPISELVSLGPRESDNFFSGFFSDHLVWWYHHCIGRFFRKPQPLATDEEACRTKGSSDDNTVSYSEAGLVRFTAVIGTVVASLLPVASIVVLYFLQDMTVRLAMFAAVQVVFVGSANIGAAGTAS
ncbi:hypothetical protein GQ53DRAFT_832439 [Thozetella sp. PMI_491]|nr:hypothetical protein GQ53DRAFT_832439 [Thozetella sp. PMI_491]